MAERPMIGTRIPQAWKTDLECIAQRTGQTVSQILYDLIAQYLDRASANSVNSSVVADNTKRAEAFSESVLTVLARLSDQVERLHGLETSIAAALAEQQLTASPDGSRTTEREHPELPTKPLLTALAAPTPPGLNPAVMTVSPPPLVFRTAKNARYLETEGLTTDEAYKICKHRGLTQSIETFRQWLAEAIVAGALPSALEVFGLVADFERRRAYLNGHAVRWLRCRLEESADASMDAVIEQAEALKYTHGPTPMLGEPPESLSPRNLAKRLSVREEELLESWQALAPEAFAHWSRAGQVATGKRADPDDLGWRYRAEDGRYWSLLSA